MYSQLSTEDPLPFHAYRRRTIGPIAFEKGPAELYSSLEHWIQSEKFRGVDEPFRQHLMNLPSPKEVRKAALRRESDISPDWIRRQNRIMAAGIWMKAIEHRSFRKLLIETEDFDHCYSFNDHYWGSARTGISVGFYGRLLRYIQRRLKKGPIRAAVIGSKSFSNPFLHATKLDALFDRGEPNEVICGVQPGLDDYTESWAQGRYLPINHRPKLNSMNLRERLDEYMRVARYASHIVIFRQGHLEGFDLLVETAYGAGNHVRLIDLDMNGKPVAKSTRSLVKK